MNIEESHQFIFVDTAPKTHPVVEFYTRLRMGLILAAGDAVLLISIVSVTLSLWSHVREDVLLSTYRDLIPLVLFFCGVYLFAGLYSTMGMSPMEELRRLTISTTFSFLVLSTLTFFYRDSESYSRASFVFSWVVSLVCLPIWRSLLRSFFARFGWWGEPVAIIGAGHQGSEVLTFLQNHPSLGFRPVVFINGFNNSESKKKVDVPVLRVESLTDRSIEILRSIRTAILIEPEIPEQFLDSIINVYGLRFSQLITIQNPYPYSGLLATTCDIGGITGHKIHQNLLNPVQQKIKRAVDLVVVALMLPFILPLMALITLAIHLDSKGSTFFGSKRIGQNGNVIRVLKFRTMNQDSEALLEKYLEEYPEMRLEWQNYQKLKDDPRVTRVGRILRKFSLDEIPQVWNIIKGEMSLVGPRPVPLGEIAIYGPRINIYMQVKPGLTGLWQVSGRNDLDYPTRIRLNEYYVRNWSIWFDLYIIARTPGVMISGVGAY